MYRHIYIRFFFVIDNNLKTDQQMDILLVFCRSTCVFHASVFLILGHADWDTATIKKWWIT